MARRQRPFASNRTPPPLPRTLHSIHFLAYGNPRFLLESSLFSPITRFLEVDAANLCEEMGVGVGA